MRPDRYLAVAFLALLLTSMPAARASVLFVAGDLRANAADTRCGPGCQLSPSDSDETWAQWAAASFSIPVSESSMLQVITYGYGGGVSQTGAVVSAGGLEPYLTLFDSAGNFVVSSFLGTCPAGANTVLGNCFDVQLDTSPLLAPGTYYLWLSAWQNMSLAENLGTGTMADDFTGLGNLAPGESLAFAFDIVLTPDSGGGAVPEPSSALLLACAGLGMISLRKKTIERKKQ